MSIDFRSAGHSGDESHHYYRQATAPAGADPLQVGDLWSDTAANLLKRCTSVSPVIFVSVEGGSSAHDLFSATHGDVDGTDTPADGEVLTSTPPRASGKPSPPVVTPKTTLPATATPGPTKSRSRTWVPGPPPTGRY
jgi:hypothetical protein